MKINLPKQGSIGDEGLRRVVQRTREVRPRDVANHVEQEWRRAVSGQARNPAKNYRKNDSGKKGADDVPKGPEDRLLVYGDEIAPYEQANEVAISPQLSQAPIKPAALGQNNGDYRGIAKRDLIR